MSLWLCFNLPLWPFAELKRLSMSVTVQKHCGTTVVLLLYVFTGQWINLPKCNYVSYRVWQRTQVHTQRKDGNITLVLHPAKKISGFVVVYETCAQTCAISRHMDEHPWWSLTWAGVWGTQVSSAHSFRSRCNFIACPLKPADEAWKLLLHIIVSDRRDY